MDVEGGNHDIPETSCWKIFGLSGKIMLYASIPKIIYYVIVIFLIGKIDAFTIYLASMSVYLFVVIIILGLLSLPSCNRKKNNATSNHSSLLFMCSFNGVLLTISMTVFALSVHDVFSYEYSIWIMCDMFYQLLWILALITYSTLLKTREAASQHSENNSTLV